MFDLSGKTAIVTGANKGIGKGMAVGLAEAGADIIGVSGSMPLQGSEIEKEVARLGRKFRGYQSDFSDRKSLYAFIEKVLQENSFIDILVNNAGTNIKARTFKELTPESWKLLVGANMDGAFYCMREVVPQMAALVGEQPFDPKKHLRALAPLESSPSLFSGVLSADLDDVMLQRADVAAVIVTLDTTGAPVATVDVWTLPYPIPDPARGGWCR